LGYGSPRVGTRPCSRENGLAGFWAWVCLFADAWFLVICNVGLASFSFLLSPCLVFAVLWLRRLI
jgi:hypothetical protein